MRLHRFRSLVQVVTFGVLTYGGHWGLRLGHFLPCFACPYVGGCSGHCYLMALQGSQWGFQMSFAGLLSIWGGRALLMFLGFFLLTVILSKTWCGWICPFGTLQDWISSLRRRFNVRESEFPWRRRNKLKPVKYVLLLFLVLIPVLIANCGFHPDLKLPFCQICPAKPLMPIFEGNFKYFAIDVTNPITTALTMSSIIVTAFFLVGIVFKDRFFCIFCPLLALISLFQKIGFVRIHKNVDSCIGCGNCERVCPVDIRQVHLEKEKQDVLTQDCIECFRCAESCPQDNTLSVKFLNWRLFSSSRDYVGKSFDKRK